LRKLSGAQGKQISVQELAYAATLIAMQELRVPFARQQMENAMLGMQEQVMRFALSVPGYLERSIEKMRRDNPQLGKDVTAEGLREAIFSGKIRLAAKPETSLWVVGAMLKPLAEAYGTMKWSELLRRNALSVCGRTAPRPKRHLRAALARYKPYALWWGHMQQKSCCGLHRRWASLSLHCEALSASCTAQ